MKINYYFMVCKKLHEDRTRPLYETVIKRIKECGDNFYFLGGFEQFDDIPVLKVTDYDDYESCVEKIQEIFYRDWDDADWHMICDDDTFIHTPNLKKFISETSLDELKIFDCGLVPNRLYGGAGILMNKKTFQALKEHISEWGWEQVRGVCHWSDVALDYVARRYNTKIKDIRLMIRSRVAKRMIDSDQKWLDEDLNILKKQEIISLHMKYISEVWKQSSKEDCPYQQLEDLYFGE